MDVHRGHNCNIWSGHMECIPLYMYFWWASNAGIRSPILHSCIIERTKSWLTKRIHQPDQTCQCKLAANCEHCRIGLSHDEFCHISMSCHNAQHNWVGFHKQTLYGDDWQPTSPEVDQAAQKQVNDFFSLTGKQMKNR